MPINSPGTLAFAPRGFEFQRSLSSTNPMINGVETFYWDPRFHGFQGDLAVNSLIMAKPATGMSLYSWIYTPAVASASSPQGARSCVYPCPLIRADQAITPTQTFTGTTPVAMQTVGVIQQFRYYPAAGNGMEPVTVNNFNNITALYPNTVVEVDIITDPHAVFRVQTYTPWGYSAAITSNGYMIVGAVNTYTVTVAATTPLNTTSAPSNYTLQLPLGEFTGPNPGSRAYAYTHVGCNQAATTNTFVSISSSATMLSVNNMNPTGDSTGASTTLGSLLTTRSIGLTKGIDGNNNTGATGIVYPNVYLDVSLVNQGFGKVPLYVAYAAV